MKQSTSFTNPEDFAATSEAPAASVVAVPSLTGVELHAALDRVREVGLVPAVDAQEVDDEGLVGTVCTQHPAAGTELPPGGVVLLLIGQLSDVEEPAAADEPEPVEEDDWFDIELPGVDQSFEASPSDEPDDRGAQAEAAMSDGPQRLLAGSDRPPTGRRPRRRAVVAAAMALAVIALLAVTARSCGHRPIAAPSPASSVPRARPATEQLRERRPPRHVQSLGSAREQRPSRRRAAPVSHVPPQPFESVPEPPRVSAPAPSVPNGCEFCPESLSP
jgi:hypothetical protein